MAFDEAHFGLINWHKKRYCPKGFRPPYVVVQRAYEWTYLYAAVDPTTGESFCVYLPGLDSSCLEAFLKHLARAYVPIIGWLWCSRALQATPQRR